MPNKVLPIFYDKAEMLRQKLTECVEKSGRGHSIEDVAQWTSKCTMDIIGSAGLGAEFRSLEDGSHPLAMAFADLFGDSLSSTFARIMLFVSMKFPLLARLPTETTRRTKFISDTVRTESLKILKLAKEAAKAGDDQVGGKDLLSLLVKANVQATDEKHKLDDQEVLGQMSTFILAGFETTGTALGWALYELARNPEIQDKLRKEIRQTKAEHGLDSTERLSVDQIASLPYLDYVTKETLRLRGPVSITIRTCAQDSVLPLSKPLTLRNGQQVEQLALKKGTAMMIPVASINVMKEIWGQDAEQFRPERWSEQVSSALAEGTNGFTLYSHLSSFLGGTRGCVGYKFALLEFKTILSTIVETLEFKERDDKPAIVSKSFIVTKPYLKDDQKFSRLPLNVSMAP